MLLHGYGQTAADFLASCAALALPARRLIAPEALSRFYLRSGRGEVGASWMTREEREHEIADQRSYLDALCARELRPGQLLRVLGFSQGAAAAGRWSVSGRAPVERLVLWGSGVPADLDLSSLGKRGTRVWLVRGSRDPAVPASEIAQGLARLSAAGVNATGLEFEGVHELSDQLLRSGPFGAG